MIENFDENKIRLFQRNILNWYATNKRNFPWREAEASTFQKIVTEVLLQRTQASAVANFYQDFFLEFKTWQDLASVSKEELGKRLKPIGLWKQRAEKLNNLGEILALRGGSFPSNRDEIEGLPGVGQYIANAIELFIYKRKKPLIDVNMARVLERYFGPRKLVDIRYDPYLQELAHRLVDCEESIAINFSILDFAALVCKARSPLCDQCPLAKKCSYVQATPPVNKS